jgi:2-polyprenyl-3-methyl-5-hydroxy-6-metoxy-1,4-benzoquinol methylase
VNKINSVQGTRKLRVLVVIASCGEKNLKFLKSIIQRYRAMAMETDLVVVSDTPKDLGMGIKVVVGLPSSNPWSLPFAHKAVFAQNADQYDLFIYSEDDIEVSEENIGAFLRATTVMGADEIPGYIRCETTPDGNKLLTDVHGPFHWKPESVSCRGDYTIAEFTNEHAGFYILTQSQLRKAIASGGFLQGPYEGRYGLPETAATDPYTCCGFRKVICISALENFLIGHMSNLYVNRHGVSLSSFKEQVQTLIAIGNRAHPASTLCEVESKMPHLSWSKSYYETPGETFLRMVPRDAKNILSIGCGWGVAEAGLKQQGMKVTAVPLDSVIGAAAARLGIDVIYGTWEECLKILDGRRFDCVFISNLLHLQREPGRVLEQLSRFVCENGTLLVNGPNFKRVSTLAKQVFKANENQKLRSFDQSGISVCGPGSLARHIKKGGLRVVAVQWLNHEFAKNKPGTMPIRLGSFTAKDWILQAQR